MQKKFATIRDYYIRAEEVRADSIDFPSLRVIGLSEGSNDLQFTQTDRNSLAMTLDGSAKHLTRMDVISDDTPTKPGELCMIPAGLSVHLAWQNHAALQRSVLIEFESGLFQTYTPEIANDTFLRGNLAPSGFASRPVLSGVMQMLSREIDPQRAQGRLFADTAIRLLALEIAASAWTTPTNLPDLRTRPDSRLRRAIEFVAEYFTTDISIVDIATAAGLSPTQLTRAFRLATGKTPYSYVIDRRLDHAVSLLRSTDLPVAYIALEAGFTDQAHLTRLCRARLGKTPGAIRRE